MDTFKINNIDIEINNQKTIYELATQNGFEIPVMCKNNISKHLTSCMVCLVKDVKSNSLIPACSVVSQPGMEIEINTDEINLVRRNALEFLLSEHQGDCEAPCSRSCPAGLDIHLMNRLIASNNFAAAINTIKQTIAIPAILGYICDAPCEKACRRKDIDNPVSICKLKRFVAEEKLINYTPESANLASDKHICIIGSGPAGLSAAYYAVNAGFKCTVYEQTEKTGGNLWHSVLENKLPRHILEAEISNLKKLGVQFLCNNLVNGLNFGLILELSDAVIIATGNSDFSFLNNINATVVDNSQQINVLKINDKYILSVNKQSAAKKMAVKASYFGRVMAENVIALVNNKKTRNYENSFYATYNRIESEDRDAFLMESENTGNRIDTTNHLTGFLLEQAVNEAKRCLHCDCRKKDNCTLRNLSKKYNARFRAYKPPLRVPVIKQVAAGIIFEKNKCIKCGICVAISEKNLKSCGFAFNNRGYDTEVVLIADENNSEIFKSTITSIAIQCPTGAISFI